MRNNDMFYPLLKNFWEDVEKCIPSDFTSAQNFESMCRKTRSLLAAVYDKYNHIRLFDFIPVPVFFIANGRLAVRFDDLEICRVIGWGYPEDICEIWHEITGESGNHALYA